MVLNHLQKSILKTTCDLYFESIRSCSDPTISLEALSCVLQSSIALTQEQIQHFESHNLLDCVEFLRKILNHPCPQNRYEGCPYVQQEPGLAVFKNNQGKIEKEPLGLLSLTSKTDDSASKVTKQDVVLFIEDRCELEMTFQDMRIEESHIATKCIHHLQNQIYSNVVHVGDKDPQNNPNIQQLLVHGREHSMTMSFMDMVCQLFNVTMNIMSLDREIEYDEHGTAYVSLNNHFLNWTQLMDQVSMAIEDHGQEYIDQLKQYLGTVITSCERDSVLRQPICITTADQRRRLLSVFSIWYLESIIFLKHEVLDRFVQVLSQLTVPEAILDNSNQRESGFDQKLFSILIALARAHLMHKVSRRDHVSEQLYTKIIGMTQEQFYLPFLLRSKLRLWLYQCNPLKHIVTRCWQRDLEAVILIRPDCIEAILLLAHSCHYIQKESSRALELYCSCIEIGERNMPENFLAGFYLRQAYNSRGILYMTVFVDLVRAQQDFRAAIRYGMSSATKNLDQCTCLEQRGGSNGRNLLKRICSLPNFEK